MSDVVSAETAMPARVRKATAEINDVFIMSFQVKMRLTRSGWVAGERPGTLSGRSEKGDGAPSRLSIFYQGPPRPCLVQPRSSPLGVMFVSAPVADRGFVQSSSIRGGVGVQQGGW